MEAWVLVLAVLILTGGSCVGVSLLVRLVQVQHERHLASLQSLVTILDRTVQNMQDTVGGEPASVHHERLALEGRKLELLAERQKLECQIKAHKNERDLHLEQAVRALRGNRNGSVSLPNDEVISDIEAS